MNATMIVRDEEPQFQIADARDRLRHRHRADNGRRLADRADVVLDFLERRHLQLYRANALGPGSSPCVLRGDNDTLNSCTLRHGPTRKFRRRVRGATRSSTPPVRSTAPTAAVSTSPSSADASSKIDGSTTAPSTDGYICGKVRRFDRRVYHDERIQHPAVRTGPKGAGDFARVTWDEALDLDRDKMTEARERFGAESVLPYHYGGSNGVLTNDFDDARFFRRFGASRLARTVCAAPTGAAATALYGKMAGVAYRGLRRREADRRLGLQSLGVRHSSGVAHQARAEERREAGRDRSAPNAAGAARRSASGVQARHRPAGRARRSSASCSSAAGPTSVSRRAHRPAPTTARRPPSRGRSNAPPRKPASTATDIATLADWYGTTSPAVIRCGWGQERNRNGGASTMAILALPAVAGKFGVRGGGYTMSNSGAWDIQAEQLIDVPVPVARREHEPPRPRAARSTRSARRRCSSSTTAIRSRPCPIRIACERA